MMNTFLQRFAAQIFQIHPDLRGMTTAHSKQSEEATKHTSNVIFFVFQRHI
jgi:hypothetical protein